MWVDARALLAAMAASAAAGLAGQGGTGGRVAFVGLAASGRGH